MISITNETGRNTDCRTVTIGTVALCFSYETLIGAKLYRTPGSVATGVPTSFRVSNSWGPTTGRHFNECGLKEALIVPITELHEIAYKAIKEN